MTTLMQASNQWATRPHDERFVSLHEMQAKMRSLRDRSDFDVASTRKIEVLPVEDDPKHRALHIGIDAGPLAGMEMEPTHWSIGQLCSLASPGNSPASYFRESGTPAPYIADCLNHNLRFTRSVDSVGLLGTQNGAFGGELRAAPGPNYGRVWNADTVDMLVDRFGTVSMVTGACRVSSASASPSSARLGQPSTLRIRICPEPTTPNKMAAVSALGMTVIRDASVDRTTP